MQQADGVPRGGRVEDDVVVLPHQVIVGQQGGELVKRGDLRGAGTGELLLYAAHHALGQLAAHRADDPLPVGPGGGLRVDLQGRQAVDERKPGDPVADLGIEHLADVGGRIRAHQQHPLAAVTQGNSGRTGEGGLAHPALAGEEEKRGGIRQKRVMHQRGHHGLLTTNDTTTIRNACAALPLNSNRCCRCSIRS